MQFIVNLCKNTIFFSTILILQILISIPSYSKDSGTPYIEQIILNNYGLNNNNYSIVQDNNGVLYINNSNGILKYNGNSWDLFKEINDHQFVLGSDGLIYVGGNNIFGIIKPTSNGQIFVSLLDNFTEKIGSIKQIISIHEQIFFCTDNKLYNWNGEKISVLKDFESDCHIFNVNNQLYVESSAYGLQKLNKNQITNLPNSKFFANKEILTILSYNDQLLIKTRENIGFYIYDFNTPKKFTTAADQYIEDGIFTSACILSNGNYAIGTALSGIVVINKEGEVQSFIDEKTGLFNLSINYLYADKNDNLWALHNQGISRIELPSAYRYFNKNQGLKGNVSSVIRFKNKLYVATSQGVYFLDENKQATSSFLAVKNFDAKAYHLHVLNEKLFVLSNKGIFEIKNNSAILFYNRDAKEITSVFHSKKNSEYFFLGYTNGISSIRFTNEIFIIEQKHSGIKDKITGIAEDKNGLLWLVANYNKIYKIDPFLTNSGVIEYNQSHNLPQKIDWINLNPISEDILFSTSNGVYRYNEEKEQFYLDQEYGFNIGSKNNWVYPIVEDSDNNIWMNFIGKDNTKNSTFVKYRNKESFKSLIPLPLNRINDFFITSIHPDNNGIVWFGGLDGLVRLDLSDELKKKQQFKTLINKVVLNSDSILYSEAFGSTIDINRKIPRLAYNLNSVKFEFSATDYKSEKQILYQYRLHGFDSNWSSWTNSILKEYTNLFEGNYTFEVRAKNILNEISNSISYEFAIKPPVYRTKVAFILYLVTLILIFILIGKWRAYYFAHERFRLENIIHERTEEVVIQKEKADNLLERVLPKNTAKELKSGRKAGPYHYNMVTVLFSDIQGFTKISEQMDSELLIDELDKFFLQFDTVVEKHNIEKIKTIGDAYMCAGGIPMKNRTNPVEVVLAAFEMQHFMKELKETADVSTKHIWDLRIGIDTGPVIAGVLGKSKISYDTWGGTVNTASRMEASSKSGKINITENTYMLIKDFFICQYRGKMPVKYKGEIDMYFVEGFKPELAKDLKGQTPNDKFFTQLQLLRVNDVEEFVLSKLEDGLPDNLYYHNVKHTIDVVTQVELIGRAEGVNDQEMLILKTAALFHDMGHLVNYDTHEEESVKLAKKILPEYKYTSTQVRQICELITVTQMPPRPKNLLEEIMCDADLDYLGRTDFVPVSINLYKELAERNKIDSILEWNQMQLRFIKNHQYFTQTAQKLREVNKKNQLQKIQEEIKREIEHNDE
jgi:class 3 adenylate cyclase/ligand-binding sensor domain-containing protein